jgi:uracil-DNA glycosylase family 4
MVEEAPKKKEKKPSKLLRLSNTPEPLEAASVERELCAKRCKLYEGCKHPFAKPLVPKNWSGKVLIVDDFVRNYTEDPVFKKISELRKRAGYDSNDFAFVGVTRCGQHRGDDVSMSQVRACRAFLLGTIEKLRPKLIIGLGANAYRALANSGDSANITKAIGKFFTLPGLGGTDDQPPVKFLVTYHPEKILEGATHLEEKIIKDFQRASWPKLEYPAIGLPATEAKGLDTEFATDGSLLTVGLANKTLAEAIEAGTDSFRPVVSRSLRETKVIIGHNVPGDIDQLIKNRLPVREEWLAGKNVLDSLILARLVDENRAELGKGAYSLGPLIQSEFLVDDWKEETDDILAENNFDATKWTTEQRTQRCRLDAWGSYHLARKYVPLVDPKLRSFIHRVVFTLHRLGLAGAKVSRERFDELGEEWSLDALQAGDLLTREALALGMTEFVPTNKNHVRELVVRHLKLPFSETTKTGLIKVDKVILKQYEKDNETVKRLLQYSKAQKLASTWYGNQDDDEDNGKRKSIAQLIDGNGLLHFWINALGARTGRRSSGGGDEGTPESRNSQNWPVIARSIIVSRWPGGKIGAHDYKSLEPVLYGWIANDARLLDYFLNGGGYIEIAREVLRKQVVKDTPEYKLVKSMTLGTFYNMGDWKLAKDLWEKLNIRLANDWDTHLTLVTKMRRDRFFPLFPGLEGYIHRQIREMEKTQRVVAPDGYVRHLPHHGRPDRGATRKEKGWWKHLQNTAVNFPVQHFASMVTGSALVDIEQALLREHGISLRDWHKLLLEKPLDLPCSVIINEVHDEVTTDYNPRTYERDKEIVFTMMRDVPSLHKLVPSFNIPLKLEAKIGPAWAINDVEE